MTKSNHAINWFEIPVEELGRATKVLFHRTGGGLAPTESGPVKMAGEHGYIALFRHRRKPSGAAQSSLNSERQYTTWRPL